MHMIRRLLATGLALLFAAAVCISIVPPFAMAEETEDSEMTYEELTRINAAASRAMATEGMVLVKNDNATLPLSRGTSVTLFGTDWSKGGGGSGDVATAYSYTLQEGLQSKAKSGKITLNQALGHAPSVAQCQAAAQKSGTAIIVISRTSGEDSNRSATKGSYYLSDNEKATVERVCNAGFGHVVVLFNICAVTDTGWITDYPQIDAVLITWQPGAEGGVSAADILVGDAYPSGKLPDTFPKDYSDFPTGSTFAESDLYVNYNEDIYVGYRYFETFAPDRVMYHFGYGLSYTDFRIRSPKVVFDAAKDTATVTATVQNVGLVPGKEVVQVYFSAPQGQLGKPARELIAFAKTRELAPGDSQEVTMTFTLSDMASYDADGLISKSAYVMEAGDYGIYVGTSVREEDLTLAGTLTLEKNQVTEQCSQILPPVLLDKYMVNRDGKVEYQTLDPKARAEKVLGVNLSMTQPVTIQAEDCYQKRRGVGIEYGNENRDCVLRIVDPNDWMNWYVNAPQEGNYQLTLRYSASGGKTSDVEVIVDGESKSKTARTFASTGSDWAFADSQVLTVPLSKGANFLQLNFSSAQNLRVDSITLAPAGAVPAALVSEKDDAISIVAPAAAGGRAASKLITFRELAQEPALMEDFVSQLTNAELANLLYGHDSDLPRNTGVIGADPAVPNIYGILAANTADGPAGLNQSPEKTTAFPTATCLASTWNEALLEEMGVAVGKEAVIKKVDVWLAPGMDIHRNPLCGRNFEYYSEDPLITGKMAAAVTRGCQSQNVGVTIKHFAANETEVDRILSDSRMTERAMREIYIEGFRIAVQESDPWCLMTGYNRINGVECAESYGLLTTILREEWGFHGLVMTDWWNDSWPSKEIAAGNDVKMPRTSGNPGELLGALANGKVTREQMETSAKRVLNLVLRSNAMNRMKPEKTVQVSATETTRVKFVDANYRHYDIGAEDCKDVDGGKNPTNTYAGRCFAFRVNVEKAGVYKLKARVAVNDTNGTLPFDLYLDSWVTLNELGQIDGLNGIKEPNSMPATFLPQGASPDWQIWYDSATILVFLPEGETMLGFLFTGNYNVGNINWFELTPASDRTITVAADEDAVSPGKSADFRAEENGNAVDVHWSLLGDYAVGTGISPDGILNVDSAETAESLYIIAQDKTDGNVAGVRKVSLTAPSQPVTLGDLNGDGKLTVTDVVLLRKAILAGDTAEKTPVGDMNLDGQLTVTDVVLLRKAILSNN